MLLTLPTSSHFWHDWPSFGVHFHKLSLDMASLTFYQCRVLEFSSCFDHLHNSNQLTSWSDRPTSGGNFCKQSLDTSALTSYRPMLEFLGHFEGASNVKYTTSLHCRSLSESDSKLYTNFEFCEGKNRKHLENTLIYKAKKCLHILNMSQVVCI
jgi:hypothetical protein